MLIAASVVTKRHDVLRRRWQLEHGLPAVAGMSLDAARIGPAGPNVGPDSVPHGVAMRWLKDDYIIRDSTDLRSTQTEHNAYRGTFVVYDRNGDVIWQENWGETISTPTGFALTASASTSPTARRHRFSSSPSTLRVIRS